MKNPRKIYAKADEELYVFTGRVYKVSDRTSYASVTFAENDGTNDEIKYISVMCFSNNGGAGVDHKDIAMKAEGIRQSLTGDDILFATIVAVKQTSPDGKTNYKARSTSFVVTQKDSYSICKNPVRAFFKPEQCEDIRIMSGYATAVFTNDNNKFKSISFRADTSDKEAGFVNAKCFPPYNNANAKVNCFDNASAIETNIKNGLGTHCVIVCMEKEFNGSPTYNALTVSYATRKQ